MFLNYLDLHTTNTASKMEGFEEKSPLGSIFMKKFGTLKGMLLAKGIFITIPTIILCIFAWPVIVPFFVVWNIILIAACINNLWQINK